MMITIRAGRRALSVCLLLVAAGCSREQQDWRSAEAADSIDSYGQFIQRHPDSELATQARTRVTQLGEDRDWQQAGSADSAAAYQRFIAQHPNGKWAQEARIRIENFSLGGQPPVTTGAFARGAKDPGVAQAGEEATPAEAFAPGAAAGRAGGGAALGGGIAPAGPASGGSPGAMAGRAAADQGASPPSAGGNSTMAAGVGRIVKGYGVQLGAFSSEAGADNEWRALVGRFGPELQGLAPMVVTADMPSGRLYRLQTAVPDEARARALCDTLRQRSQACVPVLPH